MFAGHSRNNGQEEELQPLSEHLYETQRRCRQFGEEFGNGEFAAACGLLHDLGKYSKEFQSRIRGAGGKCDHTTVGAKIAYAKSVFGKLAAYCIAGHHSGLQDSGTKADTGGEGTLYGRLSEEYEKKIPEYFEYTREIDLSQIQLLPKGLKQIKKKEGFTFFFFTHMIYSCLTDSDFLDTEYFMSGGKGRDEAEYDFKCLKNKLEEALNQFSCHSGRVNKKRKEILESCLSAAVKKRGLYRLAVPTGGGKTLSSMAFALNHLLENGHRRIIYVIPYTSIIEQNAKVFSDLFGAEVILEHHSNYDFNHSEDPIEKSKHLATENWDMPIIVTTNIQFFESMFANKSSKNRKLHNIANSVIVFDEVQMLPTEYLQPCLAAISELVYNYGCTAVLCSATQPALDPFFPPEMKINEICENTEELFRVFERTTVVDLGEVVSEELAELIMKQRQSLTIVNTRKHAKRIYSLLEGEGNYHLSTLMCPVHRQKVIVEIGERLLQNKPCTVVSTRLIEAGVDVDFPVVYRSVCGLDSVVQSAGRCNREGKLKDEFGNAKLGRVYLFKPEEEYYKHMPSSMKLPIEITREIIRCYSDIMSPEAIRQYFEKLYFSKGEEGLDVKEIMKEIEKGMPPGRLNQSSTFQYKFKKIAEEFKLIEDNTHAIIIPYDEKAVKLIARLDYAEEMKGILRALQPYSVNVFSNEFEALNGAGKLKPVANDMAVLRSREDYNDLTGIAIDIKSGIGVFY